MSEEFNLDFSETPTWLVVHYEGNLNLLVKEEFCQRVIEELEKRPDHNLALDLSAVELIDSSGLGAIFSLYKFLTARRSNLVLVEPNHTVSELLKLTHLDQVIQVEASLATVTGAA
jgi:anti-sigma B factor antagonist